MTAIPLDVGSFIPLFVTVDTGENNLQVSARVISRTPYAVVANNVTLNSIGSNGEYSRIAQVVMPDADFVDVTYTVLDSLGAFLRKGSEVFVNAAIYNAGGGGGVAAAVGGELFGVVTDDDDDVEAIIIDDDSYVGIVQLSL